MEAPPSSKRSLDMLRGKFTSTHVQYHEEQNTVLVEQYMLAACLAN